VRPEKNPSTPPPFADSGCASLSDAQGGAPTPLFFVSVAAKGFSLAVSLLFATLAGESISVAAKGLMGMKCWREGNGLGWRDLGGVRRTTGRARIGRVARRNRAHFNFRDYSIYVLFVK